MDIHFEKDLFDFIYMIEQGKRIHWSDVISDNVVNQFKQIKQIRNLFYVLLGIFIVEGQLLSISPWDQTTHLQEEISYLHGLS